MKRKRSPERDFCGNPMSTISSCSLFADAPTEALPMATPIDPSMACQITRDSMPDQVAFHSKLSCNLQHYLASCVSRLVEFVGAPGVRQGQDGFDHWLQFPSIDELPNLRQL